MNAYGNAHWYVTAAAHESAASAPAHARTLLHQFGGFTVMHSWEVGLLVWSAPSVVIDDVVAIGNAIGTSLNVYQPALHTFRQRSKTIALHHTFIAAHSGGPATTPCSLGLSPPASLATESGSLWVSQSDLGDGSPNPLAHVGRVGVMTSVFASAAPDIRMTGTHGFQVTSFPALLGKAALADVTLEGFGPRSGVCPDADTGVAATPSSTQAVAGVGIVVNPTAADVTHPHHFANLTWGTGATNLTSRLHLWSPVDAWVGADGGCGTRHCGGHSHVLLQDLDGSLVGDTALPDGMTQSEWAMRGAGCISIVSDVEVESIDDTTDVPASLMRCTLCVVPWFAPTLVLAAYGAGVCSVSCTLQSRMVIQPRRQNCGTDAVSTKRVAAHATLTCPCSSVSPRWSPT